MKRANVIEATLLDGHSHDTGGELPGRADEWALDGLGDARDFLAKRWMDLILASSLLVLLLPLLILVGLAIAVDSPGPILFRQYRVGSRRIDRNDGTISWLRRDFPLFKFRTMIHGADQSIHQELIRKVALNRHVFVPDEVAGSSKPANDPRVTRVGRLLRRSSFDELPQLLNVLRGEMSLVGPRPVPPYEVREYEPWQFERLAALPGITGLWQVRGRGRVSFDDSVRMDIEYVRRRTLLLDLTLLLLTVPAVLSGKGAR